MYEKHFNLDQLPFSIAPDPSFLYLSSAHREALAHLMYGFSHGGFVMVTGEVGTGKTTLLRNLIKQTPPDLDVAFILNPRLTVRELLATLCDELGIPYDPERTASVKQYIDLITRHLLETHRTGRSTVMIIDEAQNLSPAVLEQVRLLTNLETDDRKLLRIILIGQPELKEMLERQDLRQLAQRITARYHLSSLNREDSYAYIMHRMSRAGGNPHVFSQSALRRIFALSSGTPRLINVIADRSLLGAYTEGRHQVTGRIVSRAAKEVLGTQKTSRVWWIGAVAAVTVAGAAWAILSPSPLPQFGGEATRTTAAPETDALPRSSVAEIGESSSTPTQTTPVLTPSVDATPAPENNRQPPVETGRREESVPRAAPVLQEPVPQDHTEMTEAGESIITPQTYSQMQAGLRAQVQSRSEGEAPQQLNPDLTPDTSPVRRVEAVTRPEGSAYSNQRLAYAAVFDRWGVSYSPEDSVRIPCDFAPSAGLQCLTERGDWSQLARLDLPVVLELWDGEAAPYHAALLGLADGRVRLRVGRDTLETTQRALREQWAGIYVVLWQTPPGYYGSLREGQSHETVRWLRQQLTLLTGQPLASPTPELFDTRLNDAVLAFQAEEGLTTDGIVGPATWIRLANRLRLPQPSLAG